MSSTIVEADLFQGPRAAPSRALEARPRSVRGATAPAVCTSSQFTPACAAERLTHPLERLMDSPRVLSALGITVPLIARGVWGVVGGFGDMGSIEHPRAL